MNEVYYKGKPYQYKVISLQGRRQFMLYENGFLRHTVQECELDVKSIVSFILDAYYRNVNASRQEPVAVDL